MLVAGGSINVTTYFKMRLTANGQAATGLTATDFDLQYVRSGAAPSTKADATAGTAGGAAAHSDNTVVEPDAADQPGLYRIDWPDAAFVAGVREVILTAKVATAFVEDLRVEIDGEVNVVEWAGTDVVVGAIPAVAADGVGGLPISDAGGLDLDAKLANTDEVTVARMGALTDWINGGRLDLLLDAIKAVTDVLPDSGALTTIGTDTARLTAARAAVLTDWIDGGRLDLILDAIPTAAQVVNEWESQSQADPTGFHVNVKEVNNTAQTANDNGADINTLLTRLIGTIAAGTHNPQSGDGYAIANHASYGNSKLVRSTTPANTLDVDASGDVTAENMVSAAPTVVQNRQEMDSNSTQLAAIVGDTNELQGDWTNGGRLDLLLDAVKVKTDALPDGIQKNTALANFEFLMRDTTDHVTGITGRVVAAGRSIDGAAFGACANAVSEVANGLYKINLAAGDLNGDVITLKFTATGADATFITIVTQT